MVDCVRKDMKVAIVTEQDASDREKWKGRIRTRVPTKGGRKTGRRITTA